MVFFRIGIILSLTFIISISCAQIEATTDDGKKVILFNNGQCEAIDDKKQKESDDSCHFIVDKIDSISGLPIQITDKDSLFAFTPPNLLEEFPTEKFITGEAYLTRIQDKRYVFFKFKVKTSQSFHKYGTLEKGRQLLILFEQGAPVSLRLNSSHIGHANYEEDYTIYMVDCELPPSKIAQLMKQAAKTIRFNFSKGYQDYTITNPKYFINNLSCIK